MAYHAVVPTVLLLRAAEALETVAHVKSGHSQSPHLQKMAETLEYQDAQTLKMLVRTAKLAAKEPKQ